MSPSEFGRIERGVLQRPTLDQLGRACLAVGLKLSVKAYPVADPVRDGPQRALLERFRTLLPPAARWATEVRLELPGDLRAWDGMAVLHERHAACEAETNLHDIQALDRRIGLKQRDGQVDVVILVVADTRSNRRVIAEHRDALRPRFPLHGRQIRSILAAGHLPDRSGIILLGPAGQPPGGQMERA